MNTSIAVTTAVTTTETTITETTITKIATHKVKLMKPIIFAHGSQIASSLDEICDLASYFVVPKNVTFVWPLKKAGFNLSQKEVMDDIDMIGTYEGRNCIGGDYFDEKPFSYGQVMPNISLYFNCTFEGNDTAFTTGIITFKNIHKKTINIKNIKDDEILMNTLMEPHDDQIVPRKQIWNKNMPLSSVIKFIENYENCGGVFLNCCRYIGKGYEEKRPKFLTIPMTNEIYHSCFYTKLETLKNYALKREFPGISLRSFKDKCKFDKLKMRIAITELIDIIEIKLERDNAISSFEFHSVIEVFHKNEIPLELVIFSMGIKLKRLIHELDKFNDVIILNVTIISPDRNEFKWRLLYICTYFNKNLQEAIIKYQEQVFDYVIASAERVIELVEISKTLYNAIFIWYDKLR